MGLIERIFGREKGAIERDLELQSTVDEIVFDNEMKKAASKGLL